ncbi:hypothetical protein JCM8202v2_003171 [Rhodotorula sphaerocarpa]
MAPHESLAPLLQFVDDESRNAVAKFRFLRDARRFDFNVSHDHDLVALASVCSEPPVSVSVGIDVMKVQNPWPGTSVPELIEGLAEQSLHPLELAELRALGSESEQLDRILALWTLKEAYVKATGQGLHFDLRRLSISCSFCRVEPVSRSNEPLLRDIRARVDDRDLEEWRFQLQSVRLPDEDAPYWLAVAIHLPEASGSARDSLAAEVAAPIEFVQLRDVLAHAEPLP